MNRVTLSPMIAFVAAVAAGSTDDPRQASLKELTEGKALLEKLQNASGLDQALYASRVKAAFEKAVELDPTNVDARIALAGYYMNAPFIAGGSFKKAKKQAEAIAALDPARAHLLMAEIHSQEKEWPEALAALERAKDADANNAHVHFLIGRVSQEMKRWSEAASSFERAVAVNPQHGEAWYQLGRTGALSGENLDRALQALDVYLQRFAESGSPVFHAGAWWRRGEVLEKKGKKEEAAAAYRKSLEIRPDERVTAALHAVTAAKNEQ